MLQLVDKFDMETVKNVIFINNDWHC